LDWATAKNLSVSKVGSGLGYATLARRRESWLAPEMHDQIEQALYYVIPEIDLFARCELCRAHLPAIVAAEFLKRAWHLVENANR
jgi:hypothetical protein